MAVLKQPTGSSSMFELPDKLPPPGTFVSKCIDVKDVFGVNRKKYQSEEMEKIDLTGFLFGYRSKNRSARGPADSKNCRTRSALPLREGDSAADFRRDGTD